MNAWIECQNRCQKECQNRCQIECQKNPKKCPNVCYKECQKEGQNECRREWMLEWMSDWMSRYMPERLPDRMSENMCLCRIVPIYTCTFRWYVRICVRIVCVCVRVGINRRKHFFLQTQIRQGNILLYILLYFIVSIFGWNLVRILNAALRYGL